MVVCAWADRFDRSQSKKTINEVGGGGGGGGGAACGGGLSHAPRRNAAIPATNSFFSMSRLPSRLKPASDGPGHWGIQRRYFAKVPGRCKVLDLGIWPLAK